MENHRLCLEALGAQVQDIVKTHISLTDERLIPGFYEEYEKFFSPPYPAQSTVVTGLARQHMVLEIEGIAVLGASQKAVAVTGPK
jgi:2-iminobutanoate/2-iminopropanoate deaminase